uniref:Uncharacterized protein n=1 Tax=Arundo donax TaxID=35708 RepID=A0A0A9E6T8_ARUDO
MEEREHDSCDERKMGRVKEREDEK